MDLTEDELTGFCTGPFNQYTVYRIVLLMIKAEALFKVCELAYTNHANGLKKETHLKETHGNEQDTH